MTVNTHKKARKLRGSRTHGWGSPKKHRGAGSRGGVGMAGSGKKGQQKLNRLKKLDYKKIGKTQFKRPLKTIINDKTINLSTICEKIDMECLLNRTKLTNLLNFGKNEEKWITRG